MTDLLWLTLLSVLFVAQHLGVTSTGLRGRLVAMMGERPYLAVYSVVSIVLVVLMVFAYNDAVVAAPALWPTFDVVRLLALVLMPVALLLLFGGLLAPNPSLVGVSPEQDQQIAATGVLRITRHPVQSAILIWAVGHLLANGDAPSVLFFGSLAVVSGVGMMLIDRRKQADFGEAWTDFRQSTSLLPFVAIAGGRQSFKPGEIGWLAPTLAVVVFLVLWRTHAWFSGVPVGLDW